MVHHRKSGLLYMAPHTPLRTDVFHGHGFSLLIFRTSVRLKGAAVSYTCHSPFQELAMTFDSSTRSKGAYQTPPGKHAGESGYQCLIYSNANALLSPIKRYTLVQSKTATSYTLKG